MFILLVTLFGFFFAFPAINARANTDEMLCDKFYSQTQKPDCFQTLITIPNNQWLDKRIRFKVRYVVDDEEDGIYLKYVTENKTIITFEVVDATCSNQLRIKQINFQERIVCTTDFINKVEVINTVNMKMNHLYTLLQHDIQQDEEIVHLPDAVKNYKTTGNESNLIDSCGKPPFLIEQKFEIALVANGEYPWIVALFGWDDDRISYVYKCVGTILSRRYVLTVGHCVRVIKQIRIFYGSTSINDLKSGDSFTDVEKSFVHPNYSKKRKAHDIAILRTQQRIRFNHAVGSVCLPSKKTDLNDGVVVGWGAIHAYDVVFPVLRKFRKSIVDNVTCSLEASRNVQVRPEFFCISDGVNPALCEGSSGSPFLQLVSEPGQEPYYIVKGLVSYGKVCFATLSDVCIDVEYELDWINSIINP